SCVSGGIAARGLEFAHGYELYFEDATVLFGAGTMGVGKNKEWVVSQPLTLITKNGQLKHPKLKGGDAWCAAFTLELQAAVDAVKSGVEPEALSGALARDALKICYAEAKSIQTGRSIPVK
ncbi:MAG: gfo/Idh/MocA family oxidoreductase, partial [Gimesia sp.]